MNTYCSKLHNTKKNYINVLKVSKNYINLVEDSHIMDFKSKK